MATGPGATALTRTPLGATSTASARVNPSSGALGGRVGDGRPAVPQPVAEDGHDPPATTLEHARQDQPSEVDRAAEVDVLEPVPGRLVGLEERARAADAGVADERRRCGPRVVTMRIQRGRDRVRVGDVRPGRDRARRRVGRRGPPPGGRDRRRRGRWPPTASPSARSALHGGPRRSRAAAPVTSATRARHGTIAAWGSRDGRRWPASRGGVVGEPGLEPGTSGI